MFMQEKAKKVCLVSDKAPELTRVLSFAILLAWRVCLQTGRCVRTVKLLDSSLWFDEIFLEFPKKSHFLWEIHVKFTAELIGEFSGF